MMFKDKDDIEARIFNILTSWAVRIYNELEKDGQIFHNTKFSKRYEVTQEIVKAIEILKEEK